MTKHSPETLRRAAANALRVLKQLRCGGDAVDAAARCCAVSELQAAIDAVFSSDVSEDEREHCRRSFAGINEYLYVPEEDEQRWREWLLRERAAADAAGYARGFDSGAAFQRSVDNDAYRALQTKYDDTLTALQAKYDELKAAAEKHCTTVVHHAYPHEEGIKNRLLDSRMNLRALLTKHGSKNDG